MLFQSDVMLQDRNFIVASEKIFMGCLHSRQQGTSDRIVSRLSNFNVVDKIGSQNQSEAAMESVTTTGAGSTNSRRAESCMEANKPSGWILPTYRNSSVSSQSIQKGLRVERRFLASKHTSTVVKV